MADEYTRWKASQAKPWAESVRRDALKVRSLDELVKQKREELDGIKGVAYDKVGGSAGMEHGDDAMASLVIALVDAIRHYCEKQRDLTYCQRDFVDAACMLDGRLFSLLKLRYVNAMTWEQVADAMGYSREYVQDDLHYLALSSLYDVMPSRYRDPFPRSMNSDYLN